MSPDAFRRLSSLFGGARRYCPACGAEGSLREAHSDLAYCGACDSAVDAEAAVEMVCPTCGTEDCLTLACPECGGAWVAK